MSIFQQFKNIFTFREAKSYFNQFFVGLTRGSYVRYDQEKLLQYYSAHELVYACVNKIADVMNDAELVVEKKNAKGEWEKDEAHQIVSLFNKPNSYDVGEDFNRLRVQSEYVAGICYFEKIYSRAKLLVGLEPISPITITPKLNYDQTEILEYQIQVGGKTRFVPKENILIRRRSDLTNLFFGLSPAQVAMRSINADLGLTDYIEAFFNSDGVPSGILKVANKNLSEAEKDKAGAEWRRRFGRKGTNQAGVAVFDQNLDYTKLGSNLNELDSTGLSDRHESKICSVFGVPPILVGALVGLRYTTANATAKSALQDFALNKIQPELKSYRKWLTWNLLPEFEDIEKIKRGEIRINFDMSQVGYMQEDLDKVHDRARKDFATGLITQNQALAETKRPPVSDGDKYIWQLKQPQTLPENQNGTEQPKLLPAPIQEKKTFDFDGLTLGREPKGVELLIDLKKMVNDQETATEKINKILLKFRENLITEAVKEAEKFDEATIYQLTLSPNNKINSQLFKQFESAFNLGREQVIDDINRQLSDAKSITILEQKDLDNEILKKILEITNLTVSKLINEIQKRAVDLFILLKALGIDTSELLNQLKEKLLGESTKFIEERAGNSVNLIIQTGRDAEIENQQEIIKFVEYSAILDKNTCTPCGKADGETAQSAFELEPVPNPKCLGGERCRCFHVAVVV